MDISFMTQKPRSWLTWLSAIRITNFLKSLVSWVILVIKREYYWCRTWVNWCVSMIRMAGCCGKITMWDVAWMIHIMTIGFTTIRMVSRGWSHTLQEPIYMFRRTNAGILRLLNWCGPRDSRMCPTISLSGRYVTTRKDICGWLPTTSECCCSTSKTRSGDSLLTWRATRPPCLTSLQSISMKTSWDVCGWLPIRTEWRWVPMPCRTSQVSNWVTSMPSPKTMRAITGSDWTQEVSLRSTQRRWRWKSVSTSTG